MKPFFSWVVSLFHRHEFLPVASTYAPPLDWSNATFFYEPEYRERAFHGVTTMLYRCDKCGALKTFQMLGSRQAPPSSAKVIPLRKEVF